MASRRINDPRTRRYFEEVYLSYNAGSTRSATVSLWSVVIADLLFKLHDLSTIHGDETATSILADIETRRARNPVSPEWEWYLVEQINDRTEFLEPHVFIELDSLRKHRHLCAHPVIDGNEALFTPNQDIARSHIRVALEGILVLPPLMTRRIFDPLLEDLESKTTLFPDDESLGQYLEAKYLASMESSTLYHIFRSLWRIAMVTIDERASGAREINSRALRCIYRKRQGDLEPYLRDNTNRFDGFGQETSCQSAFHQFMREFPAVFKLLPEPVQVEARHAIQNSEELIQSARYIYDSDAEFLSYLESQSEENERFLLPSEFKFIVEVVSPDLRNRALRLGVMRYAKARSFNSADDAFENCIEPHLGELDNELLELMVNEGKDNAQIYNRGGFSDSHQKLERRWVEVFETKPDRTIAPRFWVPVEILEDELI